VEGTSSISSLPLILLHLFLLLRFFIEQFLAKLFVLVNVKILRVDPFLSFHLLTGVIRLFYFSLRYTTYQGLTLVLDYGVHILRVADKVKVKSLE
jgi:hypothetical protein